MTEDTYFKQKKALLPNLDMKLILASTGFSCSIDVAIRFGFKFMILNRYRKHANYSVWV